MTELEDIRRLRGDFEMYKAVNDERLETLTRALKRLEMILLTASGSTILLLISLVVRT